MLYSQLVRAELDVFLYTLQAITCQCTNKTSFINLPSRDSGTKLNLRRKSFGLPSSLGVPSAWSNVRYEVVVRGLTYYHTSQATYASVVSLTLAVVYSLLDCPPLREGPVDVTLGILRGVEGLAVGLVEGDILFQSVRQIGLGFSP